MIFFRCCSAADDPGELLDPGRQFTEPWGGHDHGRCDKCEGEGTALYECRSCLERGADSGCHACRGRVRYAETCPACLGDGLIDHTKRRGVSVFPAREGLHRYLADSGADVEDKVVVELEGELGEERDLDADAGALLIFPRRVVAVEPLDPEVVFGIRARG